MRRLWPWLLGAVVFLAVVIVSGSGFFTEVLWFENLGYLDSFYTVLKLRFIPGVITFLVIYLFLFVNWLFAKKGWDASRRQNGLEEIIFSKWPLIVIFLVIAIIVNSNLFIEWKSVAGFLGRTSFGIEDPLFNKDASFYVFVLPLLKNIYNTFFGMVILTLIATLIFYLVTGCIRFTRYSASIDDTPRIHLLLLFSVTVLLGIFGFQILNYNLLLSPTGVVYGAGYSDVYGKLVVNRIMQVLSAIIVIIFAINLFQNRYRLTFLALGIFIAFGIVSRFVPVLIQNIVVEPNELTKERPYIENNIRFTRYAYGLDKISSSQFNPSTAFSADDWENNSEVLSNIRLWDWRALEKSFAQLQELRYYYQMADIDIDRYLIDGEMKQVAIAAREFSYDRLADTNNSWVNRHLVFTHGYGLVISSMHNVTRQGTPELFLKDIPPKGLIPITRPEIYFGEKTNDYVIVNTNQKELDYPSGEDNVYTTYQGSGGINIGSLLRRLLFSFRFGTTKILLSNDINSASKVMYDRDIKTRVQKLVPFLRIDPDPYAILADGRIYWLIDAYTKTDSFPYSQPLVGLGNYLRGSFKIVVDAYTGDTDIYLYDETDPIGSAYQKVFPSLIKSWSDFPSELIPHIRYPEQLFLAQAEILQTYHMTNPEVFFNKEDIWEFPEEIYQGKNRNMEPYYTMVRFPGENEAEFVLMLPYTPKSKQNMVAWLAGRSDGKKYGEIVLYRFPKDRIIYGPMQIEARINQDPEISQLLSLWDQQGSSVQRGNLLVLPLNDSLLYVEPIYLQADQGQIPELRLVVLSDGNDLAYGKTFKEALAIIRQDDFAEQTVDFGKVDSFRDESAKDAEELEALAFEAFLEAEQALKSGPDWLRYGEAQAKLKDLLMRLIAEH